MLTKLKLLFHCDNEIVIITFKQFLYRAVLTYARCNVQESYISTLHKRIIELIIYMKSTCESEISSDVDNSVCAQNLIVQQDLLLTRVSTFRKFVLISAWKKEHRD